MITIPQMRFTQVRARVDFAAQAVRYEGQGAVDGKQVLHPDGRQIRQAQRQPLDEHG